MVLDNYRSRLLRTDLLSFNSFFIITLITIIIFIRIINWIITNIFQIEPFQHFYFGVILLIFICLMTLFNLFKNKSNLFKDILLTFSIGLIIDQYVFLIVKEKTGQGYWEFPSYFGMIILLICFSFYVFLLSFLKNNKRIKKLVNSNLKNDNKLLLISNIKHLFLVYFTIILIIIISRVYVFLIPEVSFLLFGYEIHHLFIGTMLLLFLIITVIVFYGLKLNKKLFHLLLMSIGIGIGLIIDEFFFLITGGITNNDYWNCNTLKGLFLFLISFSLFYFSMYFLSKK